MLAIISKVIFILALTLHQIESSLSKRTRLAVKKTDRAVYVWFI